MSRPLKRARTTFQVAQKRPIDKNLINVSKSLVTSTQAATTLITATFPCTITGIRWNGAINATAVGATQIRWAIILVKDGNSPNTMATSDGSTLYEPEQNVLTWGVVTANDFDGGTGSSIQALDGSTKTMRKLMGGDQIQIIFFANAAATVNMAVQFFCKS